MIRFLNLKDQIDEGIPSFAFYDTISNTILGFSGEEIFTSLAHFQHCFNETSKERPLSRYVNLIPKDFFNYD